MTKEDLCQRYFLNDSHLEFDYMSDPTNRYHIHKIVCDVDGARTIHDITIYVDFLEMFVVEPLNQSYFKYEKLHNLDSLIKTAKRIVYKNLDQLVSILNTVKNEQPSRRL